MVSHEGSEPVRFWGEWEIMAPAPEPHYSVHFGFCPTWQGRSSRSRVDGASSARAYKVGLEGVSGRSPMRRVDHSGLQGK